MMVMILNFFLSTDDANWNPVEWERAAEELTWERVRFLLFLKISHILHQIMLTWLLSQRILHFVHLHKLTL